jgi:hypothetical protein
MSDYGDEQTRPAIAANGENSALSRPSVGCRALPLVRALIGMSAKVDQIEALKKSKGPCAQSCRQTKRCCA